MDGQAASMEASVIVTALSDLLNASGLTARQAAERASDEGIDLRYGTIAAYWAGTHGRPTEKTLQALSEVTGIPVKKLRFAARVRIGEAQPWSPPPEADRLTQRQRRAVDELIKSMVTEDLALTSDADLFDQEMRIAAEAARLGIDHLLFDAAAWARQINYPREEFSKQFVALMRAGEVSSLADVKAALEAALSSPSSVRASVVPLRPADDAPPADETLAGAAPDESADEALKEALAAEDKAARNTDQGAGKGWSEQGAAGGDENQTLGAPNAEDISQDDDGDSH